MKKQLTLNLFFILLISAQVASAQFQFLSPRPGSKNLNPEQLIAIREGSLLDVPAISSDLFTIHGSKSGNHEFSVSIADDGKTINLRPAIPFDYSEVVTVTINPGMKAQDGKAIGGFSYQFTTRREYTADEQQGFQSARKILQEKEMAQWTTPGQEEAEDRDITGMFTVITNTDPAPGHIFFDAFSGYFVPNDWTGYHVVSNNGDSVFSRESPYANDFKLNKSGHFGVYTGYFEVLDSNFAIIKQVYPVNGYYADNHEFQILPDGHYLFIAQEYQVVDMTIYDPNYSPKATLFGTVIQELDGDQNLVFEWRGFDHIEFTEALHEDLSYSFIDFMHTNSIEVDNDGHIFCSHRHLDQVTKINRNTGEFIWRLGGVKGDVTFINEPEPFNYQHDARRIANGNMTLFDNGNWTGYSSAKEYQLDEVNKTATLVWKYSRPNGSGGYHGYWAMGSAQRLSNGNTFINWGWRSFTSQPSFTEVTPAGEIVWELKLQGPKNMVSYRAHKYEWDPCARATFKKMETKVITDHSAKFKWAEVANATEYHVQYKKHSESTWKEKVVDASKHSYHAYGLDPATKYDWRVETWCSADGSKTSNYTLIKKFMTLAERITQEPEDDIVVYPNPSNETVTLELNPDLFSHVRILNALGMPVMDLKTGEESLIHIPTNTLATGNYFIEFSGEETRIVKKLVVE